MHICRIVDIRADIPLSTRRHKNIESLSSGPTGSDFPSDWLSQWSVLIDFFEFECTTRLRAIRNIQIFKKKTGKTSKSCRNTIRFPRILKNPSRLLSWQNRLKTFKNKKNRVKLKATWTVHLPNIWKSTRSVQIARNMHWFVREQNSCLV